MVSLRDMIDPMVTYRDTPAPAYGRNEAVDALAFAVCSNGGHIPIYRPHGGPVNACDFHRRMAWAYIRVVAAAVDQAAVTKALTKREW